jgi:type I site-specific restriction endonuclease
MWTGAGELPLRLEVKRMNMFDDADVIVTYTLQEAIADGVLVEIFKNRWT